MNVTGVRSRMCPKLSINFWTVSPLLFDWSSAMGFTTSNSVLEFISSLSLSPILYVIT